MGLAVIEAEILESGHVARELGVSVEALRDWERRGVIAPPRRSVGGRRLFTRDEVEVIREARASRQRDRRPATVT